MKVGIDSRLVYYRPGGIAEYARHLLAALATLDPASTYCAIHHARWRETAGAATIAQPRRINTLTPSHHRLERWALSAELARHGLDIFHTPEGIPPARGGRRTVLTIHDLHYLHYPQFMTAASRRYYNTQIAWAVQRADHILVSSESTRRDLSALLDVPEDKMTLHALGVDAAFQPLPAAALDAVRARYGLPQTYLLFVGTFEPRKNIPGLLEALARLHADRADVPPLVLAGRRGWLYDDIFARAEALRIDEHLIWLENVPWHDLPALYNGAALLALPSHYEGFGLTALEAMACGTPPVVADRSSLPEVVGEAGLLVDPDDPASIADALARLLDDSALHARLRAAGLARARTYTWRATAETVLAVYRRVLAD